MHDKFVFLYFINGALKEKKTWKWNYFFIETKRGWRTILVYGKFCYPIVSSIYLNKKYLNYQIQKPQFEN